MEIVESLYWQRHNGSDVPTELAGLLDQDELLEDDLRTYGWVLGFAENILDEEEESLRQLKSR